MNFTKWVAAWGTATSITDRKECVYAKDLTLRYPLHMPFEGNKIRLRFSNLTGTEDVVLSKVFVKLDSKEAFIPLTKDGNSKIPLPKGQEVTSDEISIDVHRG